MELKSHSPDITVGRPERYGLFGCSLFLLLALGLLLLHALLLLLGLFGLGLVDRRRVHELDELLVLCNISKIKTSCLWAFYWTSSMKV